jgi:hypothetical protein
VACGGEPVAPLTETAESNDWFVEVGEELGVDFDHRDGRSGLMYYVETTASGGGWLDFDADGDLDLFLINGAPTPGSPDIGDPRDALYENRGDHFVDVAAAAGVDDDAYGMGMCVGDYDGDGRLDFMVTNFGPDRLYRNQGGGTFAEVAASAGVDNDLWGSNCAFGDIDADGDLDLYVSHYMDFTFETNKWCGDRSRDLRAYCRPAVLDGVTDSLYINQGDGTFTEEGVERGLAEGVLEKGFGVIMTDIDNDDDLDVYVANDGTMNRLYVNDGSGRFTDVALASGCGLNSAGLAESSMGIDLADVDEDGWIDMIMGNYSMETDSFFRNLGGLSFEEVTDLAGVASLSHQTMTWGIRFFDYDNDGDLDLAQARGHTMGNIELFESNLRYRQPNQLLENTGDGRFTEASQRAGEAWRTERVSRGLAVGDFNDDGRLDLLFTNTNDRVELLENRLETPNHWLGIRLVGPKQNRFAIGARAVVRLGERQLVREVRSGGSFQSQADLRLHFGLGDHQGPVTVEIIWPDWRRQTVTIETVDRYVDVHYQP